MHQRILLAALALLLFAVTASTQTIVAYNVEMLPGTTFRGYRHFLGGTNLRFEAGTVDWLEVDTSPLGNASCDAPKSVAITFKAPAEEGLYQTRVWLQGRSFAYDVTMKVTKAPSVLFDQYNFKLSAIVPTRNFTLLYRHFGIEDHECIKPYFASLARHIIHVPIPEVSWLTASRWMDTLQVAEPTEIFNFTANYDPALAPGRYETYILANSQYATLPAYIKVSVEMEATVSPTTEATAEVGIRLFPNPVSSWLTVELIDELGSSEISVFSSNGEIVCRFPNIKGTYGFSVADWPKGMYIVRIASQEGKVFQRRILVQ